MRFPNETPLEDVMKYVADQTKNAQFPAGLEFYPDPLGLQEADKSLSSPVSIDLDGLALGVTLRLVLKQLDLAYGVDKEGTIVCFFATEYSKANRRRQSPAERSRR